MEAFPMAKIENDNAMLRYRRLRNVAKLLRILELCLLVIFISWISSRIPLILKAGTDYFRHLISIIITPLFIFMLSNVIVLTLVLQLNTQKSDLNLYTEFTNDIEISVNSNAKQEEAIVYQDKQIVGEINTSSHSKSFSDSITQVDLEVPDHSILEQKVLLQTSQSEKPAGGESETSPKSETSGKEIVEELSNEEFQRAVEAYIEKQLMFHKQEKFSIVPGI